jgi:hypothetical protein
MYLAHTIERNMSTSSYKRCIDVCIKDKKDVVISYDNFTQVNVAKLNCFFSTQDTHITVLYRECTRRRYAYYIAVNRVSLLPSTFGQFLFEHLDIKACALINACGRQLMEQLAVT